MSLISALAAPRGLSEFCWHSFSVCRVWCIALLAGHGGEGGPSLQGATLGRAIPVWLSPSPKGPTPIKNTTSAWQSTRWLIPLPCLFLKTNKKNSGAQHCGTKCWGHVKVCLIGSGDCEGRDSPSRHALKSFLPLLSKRRDTLRSYLLVTCIDKTQGWVNVKVSVFCKNSLNEYTGRTPLVCALKEHLLLFF